MLPFLHPADLISIQMQLLCAYELVSLGGSAFCSIFTEEEWRGFEYAHDIEFFDSYCG